MAISGIAYTPVGTSSGSVSTGSPNACSAAIRPCSIAVAASAAAGTSPTAKMCGTAVR